MLCAHDRRQSAGADAILDKADFVVKQFPPLLFFSRFSLDLTAFYHTVSNGGNVRNSKGYRVSRILCRIFRLPVCYPKI